MLERQSLAMFVELAEVLHFGQTADRLNIAQSKLSNHIKRVEDAVGTHLFNRNKRAAVTLTKAGASFLTEARLVLQGFEKAERIGRLAGRGAAGPMNLGYVFPRRCAGCSHGPSRSPKVNSPNSKCDPP